MNFVIHMIVLYTYLFASSEQQQLFNRDRDRQLARQQPQSQTPLQYSIKTKIKKTGRKLAGFLLTIKIGTDSNNSNGGVDFETISIVPYTYLPQPVIYFGGSTMNLLRQIDENRLSFGAKSIVDFAFKKSRIRALNKCPEMPSDSQAIVYLMNRDQRTQDNWALLYAQYLAHKVNLPLYVLFFARETEHVSDRYEQFLKGGLHRIATECRTFGIPFRAFENVPDIVSAIARLIDENKIGTLVLDFMPLRLYKQSDRALAARITNIPIIQIDAHNIVPCWIASDKLEYAARTIRPKIQKLLDEYLTPFPPLVSQSAAPAKLSAADDFFKSLKKYEIDLEKSYDEKICNWATPGYQAAVTILEKFVQKKLQFYEKNRNDPTCDCLSDLSPWLHFGHIAAQRCVLVVNEYLKKYPAAVKVYCEEAIIRRELSDNFCFYNERYDSITGAASWAQLTLNKHRTDKRDHVYKLSKFEDGKTHDRLWNAAQKQLIKHGKLHGFMRMYWAKKILEWSESPETALEIAIRLNDYYALDGHDPNGYVGIMWSICGVHDQGWRERPVFGKIRFMNYDGCKRKFDIEKYITKWQK